MIVVHQSGKIPAFLPETATFLEQCKTAKGLFGGFYYFEPRLFWILWYNMHKEHKMFPAHKKGATFMNFRYAEKKVNLPANVHAYAEKKVTKLQRYLRT